MPVNVFPIIIIVPVDHSSIQQKSFLSTSPQAYLIVNAVGKDRLGIVSDISKHVTEIGGNVGESQAAKLGNHFSMMMLVNVPADQKSILEDRLKTLDGLKAAVFETEVNQAQYKPKIACEYCVIPYDCD